MRFRCPFGHVETRSIHGTPTLVPMTHLSREKCSIYVQLRNQGKVDAFGRAKPGVTLPAPEVASAAQAASPSVVSNAIATAGAGTGAEGHTSSTSPSPSKEGLWKRFKGGLEVGYRKVTTTGPLPPGMNPEEQGGDWEVTAETSERVGALINSWIGTGVRFLTSWLQIPEVPKETFEQDPGQAFLWRTALRGAVTSALKKYFGAKSPEHADRIVAAAGGITAYAIMGSKIMLHLSINIPKSPRLAKWRENRAKAQEEKKALAAAKAEKEQADALARLGRSPAERARPAGVPG